MVISEKSRQKYREIFPEELNSRIIQLNYPTGILRFNITGIFPCEISRADKLLNVLNSCGSRNQKKMIWDTLGEMEIYTSAKVAELNFKMECAYSEHDKLKAKRDFLANRLKDIERNKKEFIKIIGDMFVVKDEAN